jgi:quercetin dioxygenase-like cupin family protein
MISEIVSQRGTTLVRRLVLESGDATPWHVDPFLRLTVVVRGGLLAIEYRDGAQAERFEIKTGQVDWDRPTQRAHRASNVGDSTYEEVTIFFLDDAGAVPQPTVE